ncbi:MAG: replication-relaxation family protein [Actinobacteria bacterium]|nr:replication-relaxation family protein [Actinomycetota bacterium]
MSTQRVGRRQLESIRESLADRDVEIVETVAIHRFLTTRQICRFHFTDKLTKTAALRSANRCLVKLRDLRILVSLDRRIGGVRAGSGSFVWGLGQIGARLLHEAKRAEEAPARYREHEPSTTFLKHTLAVAEVALRLSEAANGARFAIIDIQREPACWRAYNGSGGGTLRIKPDLAVVSATEDFEDHWFFEIDLATEPPSRVVRTCLSYQDYHRSGNEQRRLGLFPAVVWIAPTARRKETIESRLSENPAIDVRLFRVITMDELETLMQRGAACEDPVPLEMGD